MEELQLLADLGPGALTAVSAFFFSKVVVQCVWAALLWGVFSKLVNVLSGDGKSNEADKDESQS